MEEKPLTNRQEYLIDDSALSKMMHILDFTSKTWRDPFTPAMMNLSCQAVGGNPRATQEIAIAMSLMNFSFRILG